MSQKHQHKGHTMIHTESIQRLKHKLFDLTPSGVEFIFDSDERVERGHRGASRRMAGCWGGWGGEEEEEGGGEDDGSHGLHLLDDCSWRREKREEDGRGGRNEARKSDRLTSPSELRNILWGRSTLCPKDIQISSPKRAMIEYLHY